MHPTKRAVLATVGVISIVILGLVGIQKFRDSGPKQGSPEWIISEIDSVISADRLSEKSHLCTAKGLRVLRWLSNKKGEGNASHDGKYGTPTVSKRVYDLPLIAPNPEGESRSIFRFIDQDGWKFDDVYFETHKGAKFDVWLSFAIDHPYQTYGKLIKNDIDPYIPALTSFLKIIAP